jgi:hypothetical protein
MDTFLSIGIVGVFLPFVIEKIKAWWFKKDGVNHGREVAIYVSVAMGTLFWLIGDTNIWKAILGSLAASTTMYQYVIKVAK